jgi:hypothetical protein
MATENSFYFAMKTLANLQYGIKNCIVRPIAEVENPQFVGTKTECMNWLIANS